MPRLSSTPRVARAAWIAALLLATAPLSACAAIWGFQDSLDGSVGMGDGGAGDDAGDATRDRHVSDVVVPKDVPTSDAQVTDPCSVTEPESYAYYVSEKEGTSASNCGAAGLPCNTISAALKRAQTDMVSIINVAEGSYAEELSLFAGIRVVGGWAAGFKRDTSSSAATMLVVLPKTESTTVSASYKGTATICGMTLQSKTAADAGETLYGVFATGASTKLILRDVIVSVSPGGDGAIGKTGGTGAAGKGGCDAGTGAMGMPSGMAGGNGPLGSFNATGYIAGNGEPGGTGNPGMAGRSAPMPPCESCFGACGTLCGGQKPFMSCGTPGTSGCPGQGGEPGMGGGGGGSSVGVFASAATVTLEGVRIVVMNGGAGAPGGPGGDGGAGASAAGGKHGTPCDTACGGIPCMLGTSMTPGGGMPGGNGGPGSSGGVGGGGSGGFSCALVTGADASVTLSDASIAQGAGGPGGSGAPPGGKGVDGGICSF